LFKNELQKGDISRLQLLELSGYLENYLWKHYSDTSCFEHTFSILMMVNEKFREGVPVFEALTMDPDKFRTFFKAVVTIAERFEVSLCDKENEGLVRQYVIYIHFLVNTFRSLEDPVVRSCTLRYFSLPMWGALSEARLTEELEKFPQVKRHWQHLQDQAKIAATTAPSSSSKSKIVAQPTSSPLAKGSTKKRKGVTKTASVPAPEEEEPKVPPSSAISSLPSKTEHDSDSSFVSGLLNLYIKTVEGISLKDPTTLRTKALSPVMRYLERFSEFIVDLLSQLPTRRFFNTLLDDMHILVRCRRSSLFAHPDGKLFSQLVGMIDACMHFEVHDQTGRALTPQDMMTIQNTRIHKLQTLAFTHFNDTLKDLVFSSAGELAKSDALRKHFELLTTDQLTGTY
jgi:intron-binding protein aquarius